MAEHPDRDLKRKVGQVQLTTSHPSVAELDRTRDAIKRRAETADEAVITAAYTYVDHPTDRNLNWLVGAVAELDAATAVLDEWRDAIDHALDRERQVA